MSIEVRHIHKAFGQYQAIRDLSLDIPSGELLALLGPSGCGKTTLLRIIAGLESPDRGYVAFSGEDATHVHVRDRHVGFVFQHYALFKHMSVFENVAFGLRMKPRSLRPSESQIRQKVMDLLSMVQLDFLADRFPNQLSGGQRQRIALARALAVEPKVLLLDEPFGALDAKVRKELRRWLRRLHDELHVTSIFVTHDQEEAMEVADRVVLMNHGQIEQVGTPQEVWDHPASPFVYSFLGDVNLFHGRSDGSHGEPLPTTTYVRPHDWQVIPWPPSAHQHPDTHASSAGQSQAAADAIHARLSRAHVMGPLARLELTVLDSEQTVEATLSSHEFQSLGIKTGDPVLLQARSSRVFLDAGASI